MKYLLVILIFVSSSAMAAESSCAVHGPDLYSYSASLEKQKSYRYDERGAKDETYNLGILVNNCDKAAGKFLMVGLGVNQFSFNASTFSTIYNEEASAQKCKIANNTLPAPMSDEARAEQHRLKTQLLRKCVETTITHKSSSPLKYRKNQVGCNVKRVTSQRAIIEGKFCFFKINRDSEFVISNRIKDNCLNEEFLNNNNISLREVNAATTFGIAGKANGQARDLELLPSKLYNFTLEPTSKHFPISDDWGKDYPQLPANFHVPSIEFGDIKLKNLRGSSLIKFPLLVDNNSCPQTCSNGVCTSSCNYSKPVVAEVVFSEYINGKKEYLKSWYDGSVAIPNWQGFLDMPSQNLNGVELQTGKRYQIDLVFRDPKSDYTMYSKSLSPLFRPIPGIPTVDFAAAVRGGVPTVPGTTSVHTITTHDSLQDFGVIRDLSEYTAVDNGNQIQTLNKFSLWPQYFDKICKGNKCASVSSKAYMELSLAFTLGELNNKNEYTLMDMVKIKRSRFEKTRKEKVTALPKISCPWDDLD